MSFIKGRRVVIPEFEISSTPVIRISEIRERRFSILDRYGSVEVLPPEVLASLNMTREEAEEYFEGAEDFNYE